MCHLRAVLRVLRLGFVALVVVALPVLAVLAAWAVDTRNHEGRVLRRVTLAGHPVGNLTVPELERVVSQVATEVPLETVEVDAPGGGFTTDARSLGLQLVGPATLDAALQIGREGAMGERLVEWLKSFRRDRTAPVEVVVDRNAVFATIAARDPGPKVAPVEPSIAFRGDAIVALEGKPGQGIDPVDVIAALPAAAREGRSIAVRVERADVAPRFPVSDAEELAARMTQKLAAPLAVSAGSTRRSVPVKTLQSWLSSEADEAGLHPTLDTALALTDLRKLMADAGTPSVESRFTLEGETPQVVPGRSGTQCCADESAERVRKVVLGDTPPTGAVELTLVERPPRLTVEKAQALGVKEQVASFTTKHPGGQPRVRNIHRIADLTRGMLIQPGETFSINDAVGRRTTERGFVSAPVIENGFLSEDVGGGISQYATTLFNAAFFAGLDFGEYQSHSLVISRYPYGREATMGFPAPDLEIKNTTPYGVLLWPTYTETSITVNLYSTHFVDSAQTGQSSAPRGNCRRVTTERTRTYVADGRTAVDRVFATYRPAEGIDC